jgi:hypothetical protein
MKVSCNKGVASHVGSESCVGAREGIGEALTGEDAGRVLSLENLMLRSADVVPTGGRQQQSARLRESRLHSAWSKALCMHRSISQVGRSLTPERTILWDGSREIPGLAWMVIQVRGVDPQGERRR